MPVTPKRAQELALLLEDASAAPHFERIAFRTPRRIFATLGRSSKDMNFMLTLLLQKELCAEAPTALAPVAGGWGRMGWTRCDLTEVDAGTFRKLLTTAHQLANAPRPTTRKTSKRRA